MTESDFPLFRASLAPEYAGAEVSELDRIAQAIYGSEATAESVEGFFGDIGRGFRSAAGAVGNFAKKAAPMVVNALPAIASGAAGGAALGPWGALAGAVAGGAGSILSQTKNPTARAIGGGLTTATNLASTIRGGGPAGAMGALGSLGGGAMRGVRLPHAGRGGGSANALMGLLGRPELLQSVLGGALGQFGRQSVPVGGQQIPTSMLLNALGTLSNRAAHEMAAIENNGESLSPEFVEASEALGLDADDVEGRTDTLLTLLALQPMIWGNRPPVVVNTPPPAPTSYAYPPIPVASPAPGGETVWIAESGEDYREEESWPDAGSWESGEQWDQAYV